MALHLKDTGIDFADFGHGSGSMSAELLNDYEEGTFSPTGTATTGNAGRYTKIGRTVHCHWYSRNDGTTPSRTDYAGLPFTGQSGVHAWIGGVAVAYAGNMGGKIVARIPDGTAEIDFTEGQTVTLDLTNAWLELEFAITYEVD